MSQLSRNGPEYPYTGHDRGVVVTQPRPGEFEERPMTTGELSARDPALRIAKDIYRHANYAGVCYVEIWELIAEAMDRTLKSTASEKQPSNSLDCGPLAGYTEADARLQAWYEAASPYATPTALKAALSSDLPPVGETPRTDARAFWGMSEGPLPAKFIVKPEHAADIRQFDHELLGPCVEWKVVTVDVARQLEIERNSYALAAQKAVEKNVAASAITPRKPWGVTGTQFNNCLHLWEGPGAMPAKWDCKCGTRVYRSREDAVDD